MRYGYVFSSYLILRDRKCYIYIFLLINCYYFSIAHYCEMVISSLYYFSNINFCWLFIIILSYNLTENFKTNLRKNHEVYRKIISRPIVEDFDVFNLFLGNFSCQISHLQVLSQKYRKTVLSKIFTIISHK